MTILRLCIQKIGLHCYNCLVLNKTRTDTKTVTRYQINYRGYFILYVMEIHINIKFVYLIYMEQDFCKLYNNKYCSQCNFCFDFLTTLICTRNLTNNQLPSKNNRTNYCWQVLALINGAFSYHDKQIKYKNTNLLSIPRMQRTASGRLSSLLFLDSLKNDWIVLSLPQLS